MLVRFARSTAGESRLLDGLAACFADCNRFEVVVRRPDSGRRSRRDELAAARAVRVAALRQELGADPLVRQAQEVLGAELLDVCLPDDPPRAVENG